MAPGTTFKNFVEDQLSGLDGIVFRSMFGGYGIYRGKVFFGILHEDRLYFRANGASRADYEARGMTCFQPGPKQKLKNYLEVPAEILEDRAELASWARRSCEA